MAKKSQPEPGLPVFEFHAHATPSLYGEGTKSDAARLTAYMNIHRSLNVWSYRLSKSPCDPILNIAHELKRHQEAA